ncbi:MAG TPA: hypothetical protein PK926_03730 [Spirochaetota bacterium]|nr:hypothetical protein [Spirochaetota bacterium]HPI90483.1 hypothetical protein [Spirochaetota bacterium]HPR46927.1 hypothetical protein [Spirochaetota bacterium]
MSGYEQCKACGLVMKADKKYEICPACGVPRSAFVEYRDSMSEQRRFWLELHLHPITVHFPQALSTLMLVFLLAGLALPLDLSRTTTVFAALLPLTALGAFASGLFDARIRFKKLTTPFVKQKIILGAVFFALTAAIAVLVFTCGLKGNALYAIIAASVGAVACQAVLGIIGIKLMFAKLPGK